MCTCMFLALNKVEENEFYLAGICAKGKYDYCESFMEKNPPGAPIVNVIHSKGIRRDICVDVVPFSIFNIRTG